MQGLNLPGSDQDLCHQVGVLDGPWWVVGFGASVGSEAWSFFGSEVLGEVVWEVVVLVADLLASLEWVQVLLEAGVWVAAWWVEELGMGLLWEQVPGQGLAQVEVLDS